MPLDAQRLRRHLTTRRVGRDILCFDALDSTNDTAWQAAAAGAGSDGLVVSAELQRRGRGRLGRRWLSPVGTNLTFSVVLAEPTPPAGLMTVAVALAIAEAVEQGRASAVGAQLKWPNDVMLDDRKLAGVLIEQRRVAGRTVTVVGVGLNANARPGDAEVDTPAISLAEATGGPVDRGLLLLAVLERLDAWLAALLDEPHLGAGRIQQACAERCSLLGRRITVAWGDRRCTGLVLAVDPLAQLVLRDDDGALVHVPAGQATILKQVTL